MKRIYQEAPSATVIGIDNMNAYYDVALKEFSLNELAKYPTFTFVKGNIADKELINNKKSPIQDEYIEKYLAEKELDLTATLDAKEAYSDADFVVIAAPTNVYSTNHIDVETSKRTCFAHYIGH